ncbi:MFS multidrug transporter [Geopyxis carbonaria]|nr:MFS multidrug transporter [Geopyxis carbonaria]
MNLDKSTSSDGSSSFKEKDIEAGRAEDIDGDTSSVSTGYDEGVVRVTTATNEDPANQETIMRATKTLSKSHTTRTQKDLEAVLNTPFEVKWEGKEDMEYPMNWSLMNKGLILFLVSMQTLVVYVFASPFTSRTVENIMHDIGSRCPNLKLLGAIAVFFIQPRTFPVVETTIILGMTTYLCGLAAGPMFLAPLSELYGRRPVYLVSLVLYFIFVIPACVAKNFATILVVRFIGAFMGSVTISNAPGTIGDIFDEKWRTLAFSCFCLAPMNGPVLGPVVGGFVYQSLGWRWNNWLVLILAGVFGIIGFWQPETYSPVLLRKRAEQRRKETGDERYMSRYCYKDGEGDFWKLLKVNLSRPVIMLFTEPICMFWAIYVAAVYGILYLCFTAYPIVFSEKRGWGPGISGLAFLGIGIGTCIAVLCEPISRKLYNMHAVDPDTGKRPPEARIVLVCFASVIIPLSIFWFAWTCVPVSIHWIWPILSGVPYGLGNVFVFLHANNYLVTSYDVFAASAMAGNAVTRSILGGVMPIFGPIMYHRLGPNIAATIVACIATALIPIPWVFYKWGKTIRNNSPMLTRLQKEKAERGE